MSNKRPFDFGIFITVLILLAMGVIMVFSASSHYALTKMGNSYHFLIRQLLWAGVGLAAMLFMASFNYKQLKKISFLVFILGLALLVIVFIPGIGDTRNNATRWIDLRFTTVQPSEIMKLGIILFFAASLAKRGDRIKKFWAGLCPYLIIIGVIDVLLLLEPHMSAAAVITAIGVILLFAAGAKVWHFVLLAAPALAGAAALIVTSEYRLRRITAFLDPWQDKMGDGWQIIQSLYAIGSGGLFGLGLGKSRQKFLYIPEPHNDFIFSILAEELGFVGVVAVLALFLIFIWRGLRVAMSAPDLFGGFVALGITMMVAIQVVINIAVVTSSMPVTGMSLPFFSYGGTALSILMAAVGILLNISRHADINK